jgi:hypothetical protein
MCFPPPAFLFHEPSIDCITINGMESGSTQDAPLKATANWARGMSSSMIRTYWEAQNEMINMSSTDSCPAKVAKHTSEPVKEAGSLATNMLVVVGSVDNLSNNFVACSTISSCFTLPEAVMTWKHAEVASSSSSGGRYTKWNRCITVTNYGYHVYHSRSCIMSCNVLLQVLFGDWPHVICRAQDWSPKRCILKCSCMEMIKYNLFRLTLDLNIIEIE